MDHREIVALLKTALITLDAASPLEHYEVSTALEPVGKAAKEAGETIDELRFEFIGVYLALYDEPNVWGTYYGPEMSSVDKDGNRFDTPSLESITPDCIAYWTARMNAAKHPALRARYADMVWDLSHKAIGAKPSIDTARIAIDGYGEAMTEYPDMSSHSWGDIRKRIIDLALSINDEERVRKAVAANVAYANAKVDHDESEFRQRSLFAILRSIPPKRRPHAEFQAVVDDFRRRVETLDAEGSDQFSMDHYALPLADHYWSIQQKDEAKAMMRMYRAAVERMAAKTTMATLAVGWLNQLYELLVRFEMNDEAKQVLKQMEELQPRVPDDLVPISTSQHFTKKEIDEWLNWLVTDDVDVSFANLEGHFLPHLDELRRQLEDIKKDYPLSQMFTATLVDHKGRAVAEVAPNDAEGKLIQQINQDIQFRSTFLELGLKHLCEKHAIGPDELFARAIKSPVWHVSRHAILRRGIDAAFADDPIVAIHILVTEIENALRNVAAGLELNLQKPNRMGGYDLKNLGDFLADETVAAFLTEDVVTYLRVVLTDRRGWNLRNGTCHGILPAANFSQHASLRLLHIILLLSAIQTKADAAPTKEQPHEPPSSADTPQEGGV